VIGGLQVYRRATWATHLLGLTLAHLSFKLWPGCNRDVSEPAQPGPGGGLAAGSLEPGLPGPTVTVTVTRTAQSAGELFKLRSTPAGLGPRRSRYRGQCTPPASLRLRLRAESGWRRPGAAKSNSDHGMTFARASASGPAWAVSIWNPADLTYTVIYRHMTTYARYMTPYPMPCHMGSYTEYIEVYTFPECLY
jgi:hypothetical protein